MAIRYVRPHTEGGWQVTGPEGRDSAVRTTTQDEAVAKAQEELVSDGGGELIIHGIDGAVRDTRTVTP